LRDGHAFAQLPLMLCCVQAVVEAAQDNIRRLVAVRQGRWWSGKDGGGQTRTVVVRLPPSVLLLDSGGHIGIDVEIEGTVLLMFCITCRDVTPALVAACDWLAIPVCVGAKLAIEAD